MPRLWLNHCVVFRAATRSAAFAPISKSQRVQGTEYYSIARLQVHSIFILCPLNKISCLTWFGTPQTTPLTRYATRFVIVTSLRASVTNVRQAFCAPNSYYNFNLCTSLNQSQALFEATLVLQEALCECLGGTCGVAAICRVV